MPKSVPQLDHSERILELMKQCSCINESVVMIGSETDGFPVDLFGIAGIPDEHEFISQG
jgi:hypothetical protein